MISSLLSRGCFNAAVTFYERLDAEHHAALHDEVRQLERHELECRCPNRDVRFAERGTDDQSCAAVLRRQQHERAPVLQHESTCRLKFAHRPSQVWAKDSAEIRSLCAAYEITDVTLLPVSAHLPHVVHVDA